MNYFIFLSILFCFPSYSYTPFQADWSEQAIVELGRDRSNIYNLEASKWNQTVERGKESALIYPVNVSAMQVPYRLVKEALDDSAQNPFRRFLYRAAKIIIPFDNTSDFYRWLGLHPYPESANQSFDHIPNLSHRVDGAFMGASLIEHSNSTAITFSCAACHSGDLFGKKVLGMSNRFPRANELFMKGQSFFPLINLPLLKIVAGANDNEMQILREAKTAAQYVGVKLPQALGLDTSLAQVALSLAKRKDDAYASRDPWGAVFPRYNPLQDIPADSKPAVWWNLKYKTRWLSDGSVVSGNPIYTNFLWNELGRGSDLGLIEKWMDQNFNKIQDLTATVFATKAPHYTDFFPPQNINFDGAKRGQKLFRNHCSSCHGTYIKKWELGETSLTERLKNQQVIYHQKTPVEDVGTDPLRYQGMAYFADDLNRLAISKKTGTKVIPQRGYVPPPLVGIWARWPYLHNNSIANLCQLLTPAKKRAKSFWMGPANDPQIDFDQKCNGYPLEKVPVQWTQNQELFFDTNKEGLSNQGHEQMLFDQNGREIFNQDDKTDLIAYLKTL